MVSKTGSLLGICGGIAVSTLVTSTTNYGQILMVNSDQQPFIIITESIKILMIPVDGLTKYLWKIIRYSLADYAPVRYSFR